MLRKLQTEYMPSPVGIDVASPRFSWQMVARLQQKGLKQKAFCIQVFNVYRQLKVIYGIVHDDSATKYP